MTMVFNIQGGAHCCVFECDITSVSAKVHWHSKHQRRLVTFRGCRKALCFRRLGHTPVCSKTFQYSSGFACRGGHHAANPSIRRRPSPIWSKCAHSHLRHFPARVRQNIEWVRSWVKNENLDAQRRLISSA